MAQSVAKLPRSWLARFLAVALLSLLPATPHAQPPGGPLKPVAPYAELFIDNPKVSGNLLVGLRWGGPDGRDDTFFDPDNVGLALPRGIQLSNVCVDIVSKDGRYTAENLYEVGSAGTHPTLGGEHDFRRRLQTYRIDDMAVMVRLSASCDGGDTDVLVPAIVTPASAGLGSAARDRLVAYVNADPAKVRLSLLGRDMSALAADMRCADPGPGVRIAYSAVCVIVPKAPLPDTRMTLRLATRERFRTVNTDFALLAAR